MVSRLGPKKALVDGWSCPRCWRKRASHVMAGYLFFLETTHPHLESPKKEPDLWQDAGGSRDQGGYLTLSQETMQTEGEEAVGAEHQDTFEDEESDGDGLDKDSTCPSEEDTVHVQGTPRCKSCHYVLVRTPKTFYKAQVSDRKTT